VILTRLVVAADVGTALLVSTLHLGLVMVTDAGFLQAMMQSKRGDDPRFLDTIWTLQAIRGAVLAVVCLLVAWPYARFYDLPTALLYVTAAQLAVSGLHSTAIYQLRRQVNLQWVVSFEVIGQLLGVAITLTWAWIASSPWALVGGGAVKIVVDTIASHFLPGRVRHRFRIDRAAVAEIRAVARWVMGSSAVSFLGAHADRLVIGRLLGEATLGIYSIAINLAEMVGMLVLRLLFGIVYPVLANEHRRDDPARLRSLFYASRWRIDVFAMSSLGALTMLGPWLVSSIWTAAWHEAGWMLQILCVRTALDLVSNSWATCLTSIGEQRLVFLRNVVRTVSVLAAMPIGFHLGGPSGLLWGLGAAEVPAMLLLMGRLQQLRLLWFTRELLVLPAWAAGAGVAYTFRRLFVD
jgi:O-antigen/teichoic acid export membrane protein